MRGPIVPQRDWIMCAVCDKLVDRIETWPDPVRQATIITVHCHGQTETASLDDYLLVDAAPGGVSFGRAFARSPKPALGPAPVPIPIPAGPPSAPSAAPSDTLATLPSGPGPGPEDIS